MSELTLSHTIADGTLLAGTEPGDGAVEVVKPLGWRWGSGIGSWYVPRSRDHAPRRDLIERTAAALRGAGFVVDVEIDATPGDQRALDEQRAERALARAERLTAKAEAERARADQHHEAAQQIAGGIPLGQPILVGHHSESRHRRDIARMRSHDQKAADSAARAAELARAAAAAKASAQPVAKDTLGNRIEQLRAQLRRDEPTLARLEEQGHDKAALALRDQVELTRAKLAAAEQEWADRVGEGDIVDYGPKTVKPGDAVKISGIWRRVVKANPKSVAVETGYSWTDRVPWHKVTGHRPAA